MTDVRLNRRIDPRFRGPCREAKGSARSRPPIDSAAFAERLEAELAQTPSGRWSGTFGGALRAKNDRPIQFRSLSLSLAEAAARRFGEVQGSAFEVFADHLSPRGLAGLQKVVGLRPKETTRKLSGSLGREPVPGPFWSAWDASDRRCLQASDARLIEVFETNGAMRWSLDDIYAKFPNAPAEVTHLLARTCELGHRTVERSREAIDKIVAHLQNVDEETARSALWRLALAAKWNPEDVWFKGERLFDRLPKEPTSRHATTHAIKRASSRHGLPIGERQFHVNEHFRLMMAGDAHCVELSDRGFAHLAEYLSQRSDQRTKVTDRRAVAQWFASVKRGILQGSRGAPAEMQNYLYHFRLRLAADPSLLHDYSFDRPAPKGLPLVEGLRKLARTRDPKARRETLFHLLAGCDHVHEFPVLFREGLKARLSGYLKPVSLADLSPEEATQFMKDAFGVWEHSEAAAILASLFTDASQSELKAMLRRKGDVAPDILAHLTSLLQTLTPYELEFVLRDINDNPEEPDFSTLELRMSLIATNLDAEAMRAIVKRFSRWDPDGSLRAVAQRLAHEKSDSPLVASAVDFARDTKNFTKASEASTDAVRIFEPKVYEATLALIEQGIKAASDPKAFEPLLDGIREATCLNSDVLTQWAVRELIAFDASRISKPRIGGERAAVLRPKRGRSAELSKGSRTKPSVRILGHRLPIDTRPNRDLTAIPTEKQARFVLTPTAAKNIESLLTFWNSPLLALGILGGSGTAKTSAIRFLCHVTEKPYRRIVVGPDTELGDLFGKWVGGERIFDRATLEAKSESELRGIARKTFMIDMGHHSTKEIIEQILEIQEEVRWVDGPVTKALLAGEVVVLDEYLTARPLMRGGLNGLLDDRGILTIPDRPEQVVRPAPGAKLIMTSNDSDYAGRKPLTAAEKRRWRPVEFQAYRYVDFKTMLDVAYGDKIPKAQRQALAQALAAFTELSRPSESRSHDSIVQGLEDVQLGRESGGCIYTPRDLFKIADRFVRFEKSLPAPELMRREAEEVFMGGLRSKEDLAIAKRLLDTTMPYDGRDFYADLKWEETPTHFIIGDVERPKYGFRHSLREKKEERALAGTKRTRKAMYLALKAISMRENVYFEGAAGGGKTALPRMIAAEAEQPFFSYVVSDGTDSTHAIGIPTDAGIQPGYFLRAMGWNGEPPYVVLEDELNQGDPAFLARRNSILDDERRLVAHELDGREIRIPEEFTALAAGNPYAPGQYAVKQMTPDARNRYTFVPLEPPDTDGELLAIGAFEAQRVRLKGWEHVVPAIVELHQWLVRGYDRTAPTYENLPDADRLGEGLLDKSLPDLSFTRMLDFIRVMATQDVEPGEAFRRCAKLLYGDQVKSIADKEKIARKVDEIRLHGARRLTMLDAEELVPVKRPEKASKPRTSNVGSRPPHRAPAHSRTGVTTPEGRAAS